MSTTVSVIVPVFNEEAGLAALFERLYPALDALGRDYEGLDDVLLVAVTEKRTPADVDRLAVTDGSQFIGTVSLDDIVRLDDVIDRTRYGTSTAG